MASEFAEFPSSLQSAQAAFLTFRRAGHVVEFKLSHGQPLWTSAQAHDVNANGITKVATRISETRLGGD